jgi:signal transduction histidine kinase
VVRTRSLTAANQALQAEIAERRRVEDERARLLVSEQHARAEAQAAAQLRDQFLSIASHELKTPLTSLLGYVHLLMRRTQVDVPLTPRDRRAIEVISEQVSRLKRLIEMLLDISRMQSDQFVIEREPVDITALARRVVAELKHDLDLHAVTIRADDGPLVVLGDELRLEQVLQNLLQNAIKYSPHGGEIDVALHHQDDSVCMSVTDRGMGIPQEALPLLFQRFYRAENADAHQINGMGIGLYVVKEIVSNHGGTVEVTSTEGVGSTFTVHLPLG